MINTESVKLLFEEYKEAMNQRRHLETMRSSYMGAYFAFLVGLLGLVSALLQKNATDHWVAVSVPIFLSILTILTTMIYISTRKISALLGYYDNMSAVVRRRVYGTEEADELENAFKFYDNRDPVLEKRLFSLTGMIDNFLQFMGISLFAADVIAITFWQTRGLYHPVETVILSFICLALLILLVTIRWRVASSRDPRFAAGSRVRNGASPGQLTAHNSATPRGKQTESCEVSDT
jgi:hypothetical protein